MATAGRTVLVSGLTVALALASLLIFPQVFLRSMGFGGMFAVLVAMLAALTVLPALLAVLGPRVNALRIPLPWRRGPASVHSGRCVGPHRAQRHAPAGAVRGRRHRAAAAARGAVPAACSSAASTSGCCPSGTEPRVVAERIRAEFPGGTVGADRACWSPAAAPAAGASRWPTPSRALPDVTGARPVARPRRVVAADASPTAASPPARRRRTSCARSARCPSRPVPRCSSAAGPRPTSTCSPASAAGCRGWR